MSRSILLPCSLVLTALVATGALPAADDAPQPEELFRTLDADGDDRLTADEIDEPQRPAFERLLRLGDADNDGRLTREEYLSAFQPDPPVSVAPNGGRGPAGNAPPQRPDFGRLFAMADRDSDGKVALADLPAPLRERMRPLFERLGKEQLTREDFERLGRLQRSGPRRPAVDDGRLFERFDKSGDGKLTRDEIPELLRRRFDPVFERLDKDELIRADFQQALRQQRGESQTERGPGGAIAPERPGQPAMALVRLLDADGDGQLTTAELESLSRKFAELDADGDGKLSGAELRGLAGRPLPEDTRGGPRREGESVRPRRPDGSPPGSE